MDNAKAQREVDAILTHLEDLHAELEEIRTRLDALADKK
jgi:hypothetical protein